MNITAINVFIEVDGKQCVAFINPEAAELFVGMLPAMQSGNPNEAKLYTLPDGVVAQLTATRKAMLDWIEAHRPAARK